MDTISLFRDVVFRGWIIDLDSQTDEVIWWLGISYMCIQIAGVSRQQRFTTPYTKVFEVGLTPLPGIVPSNPLPSYTFTYTQSHLNLHTGIFLSSLLIRAKYINNDGRKTSSYSFAAPILSIWCVGLFLASAVWNHKQDDMGSTNETRRRKRYFVSMNLFP